MTSVAPTVFDAHLHIIDPRFPLVANQGFLPDPFAVADYRGRLSRRDTWTPVTCPTWPRG